jgi:hypothetical protein
MAMPSMDADRSNSVAAGGVAGGAQRLGAAARKPARAAGRPAVQQPERQQIRQQAGNGDAEHQAAFNRLGLVKTARRTYAHRRRRAADGAAGRAVRPAQTECASHFWLAGAVAAVLTVRMSVCHNVPVG